MPSAQWHAYDGCYGCVKGGRLNRQLDGMKRPAGSTIAVPQPLGDTGQLSGLCADDRTSAAEPVEGQSAPLDGGPDAH